MTYIVRGSKIRTPYIIIIGQETQIVDLLMARILFSCSRLGNKAHRVRVTN